MRRFLIVGAGAFFAIISTSSCTKKECCNCETTTQVITNYQDGHSDVQKYSDKFEDCDNPKAETFESRKSNNGTVITNKTTKCKPE